MRRVLVLGCPGAGKSTLARSLGEALSLPVVHLDKLWWKSGWINRTEGEFDALLDTVLLGEEWVIDGNYLRTLPRRLERCDAVVLLDYPRQVCLFRALRRILSWRGRTRPFVRWIWEFHRTQRPQVLELLDGWTGEKHVFRSPKDCARFLAKLEREGQTWRKF